jgi:hypothetical protein
MYGDLMRQQNLIKQADETEHFQSPKFPKTFLET